MTLASSSTISKPVHFLNTRLKPVDYHGTLTHPIYVRVVFKRYNAVFKCYYFDLFSKKKYQINFAGMVKFSTVAESIAFEENVITLISDNLSEDFALARFKASYEYYTKDIC
ncbi:hypothetical protein ABIE50_005416 [Chitinophaga sp. OAE865]